MKLISKFKYVGWLLMAVVCLLLSAVAVNAEDKASIKYVYAVSGVEFKLYKVGDVDEGGNIKKGGRLNAYPVDLTDKAAAQTLASYIERDEVEPTADAVTNADKTAVFDGLDSGVYLIVGESSIKDNVKYEALPVLALVNDDDVTINGKFETQSLSSGGSNGPSSSTDEKTPSDSSSTSDSGSKKTNSSSGGGGSSSSVNPQEVSVLKVWKGDKGASEVTAQLLRNGKVYDEVVLNDDNNWRYTWSKLSRGYTWSVVEKSVPDGYSVSIQKDGSVYVITNTASSEEQTDVPNNPNEREEPLNPAEPGYSENYSNPDNPVVPGVSENTTGVTNESISQNELDKSTDVSENDSNDTIDRSDKTQKDSATSSQTTKTEKLPQTGQLWLPAILLACVGVLFLIIGIGRRRLDK
jgi:hypothetical protein